MFFTQAWLDRAGITDDDPLFRRLTAAARTGASVFKMREVSRYKSMPVLALYGRDAELFRDHAGKGFP